MTCAPIVLALDLSLTRTGWAHNTGEGVIVTHPGVPIEERLAIIVASVIDTAHQAWAMSPLPDTPHGDDACWPDLVVIEDLVTRTPAASLMGMVHGAVRHRLYQCGIPIVVASPATLKKYATGRGNANKADMRMALYQRLGVDFADDNVVDATWLHALTLDHYGHPLCALPNVQRAAITKIPFPTLNLPRSGAQT
jgi:hypothetical protein